jgi:hypothetical protein
LYESITGECHTGTRKRIVHVRVETISALAAGSGQLKPLDLDDLFGVVIVRRALPIGS